MVKHTLITPERTTTAQQRLRDPATKRASRAIKYIFLINLQTHANPVRTDIFTSTHEGLCYPDDDGGPADGGRLLTVQNRRIRVYLFMHNVQCNGELHSTDAAAPQ